MLKGAVCVCDCQSSRAAQLENVKRVCVAKSKVSCFCAAFSLPCREHNAARASHRLMLMAMMRVCWYAIGSRVVDLRVFNIKERRELMESSGFCG